MTKITVLHDELERFENEDSGFSVLLSSDKKVLFDVSFGSQVRENSEKAGINLDDVDCIVLSHGHWDHVGSLKDFKGHRLVAHPHCFVKRHRLTGEFIGMDYPMENLKRDFTLQLTRKPFKLSQNMIFLGEIPRKSAFEAKRTKWYYLENGERKEDHVLDDSAIAVMGPEGLTVVSGCSHAGICNIISYAREVCHEDRVNAVLGGFHLFSREQTDRTIDFMKSAKVKNIYPMHCLDEYAFSEFAKIGAVRLKTLGTIDV